MKKDNPPNTNFWFGFALGSITLTAAAYLLGTAQGRVKLRQLIEYADSMNDLPEEFFKILPTIKDMLNSGDTANKSNHHEKEHASIPDQITQSMESLIEKVKHTAEDKDSHADRIKKYFIKSDS